jgi:hypothetical protein
LEKELEKNIKVFPIVSEVQNTYGKGSPRELAVVCKILSEFLAINNFALFK